jgi:hypothetical protein
MMQERTYVEYYAWRYFPVAIGGYLACKFFGYDPLSTMGPVIIAYIGYEFFRR